MAKWEAEESRKAQDVDPVRRKDDKVGSTIMTGRGGGGNVHKVKEDDNGNVVLEDDSQLKKITSREGRPQERERKGSFLDKARDELAKIRGNSAARAQRKGSAASTSSASSIGSSK